MSETKADPVAMLPGIDAELRMLPRPGVGCIWTTLPTETLDDKVRAVNLATVAGRHAEEVMGQDIEIQHIMLKGLQLTNEKTGEVSECILALLIPPSGAPVQCVSWGVIGSLETISSIVGKPPWNPTITVRLKQIRTKSKMLTYQLELVKIGS